MLGRSAEGGLLDAAAVWEGRRELGVIAGRQPLGLGMLLGGVSGANVRVQATGGSIIDGGDTDKEVTATGAQLVAGVSVGAPAAGVIDTAVTTLAASGTACRPFATPLEGGGVPVPSFSDLFEPGNNLICGLGMVSVQGTPLEDTLYGFRHIEP